MKLTINIFKSDEVFIGSINEYPAILTQGKTVKETGENLFDALQLYLDSEDEEPYKASQP